MQEMEPSTIYRLGKWLQPCLGRSPWGKTSMRSINRSPRLTEIWTTGILTRLHCNWSKHGTRGWSGVAWGLLVNAAPPGPSLRQTFDLTALEPSKKTQSRQHRTVQALGSEQPPITSRDLATNAHPENKRVLCWGCKGQHPHFLLSLNSGIQPKED